MTKFSFMLTICAELFQESFNGGNKVDKLSRSSWRYKWVFAPEIMLGQNINWPFTDCWLFWATILMPIRLFFKALGTGFSFLRDTLYEFDLDLEEMTVVLCAGIWLLALEEGLRAMFTYQALDVVMSYSVFGFCYSVVIMAVTFLTIVIAVSAGANWGWDKLAQLKRNTCHFVDITD